MKSVTATLIFGASFLCVPIIASCQPAKMLAFAKANANLFPQEAKEAGGLRVGSIVTFPTQYDLELGSFDSKSGELVIAAPGTMDFVTVVDACRNDGQFVGRNAFGAKATVAVRRCDQLVIEESTKTGLQLGERRCANCSEFDRVVRIPMSPAQYRSAKAKGLRADIEFEIGTDVSNELVRYQEFSEPATVQHPQLTVVRLWKLQGAVQAVRWYRPGEVQPVREQRR